MDKTKKIYVSVEVEKIRDKDGKPTCWVPGKECPFLYYHYGFDCYFCTYLKKHIDYKGNPHQGCPVWGEKEVEKKKGGNNE